LSESDVALIPSIPYKYVNVFTTALDENRCAGCEADRNGRRHDKSSLFEPDLNEERFLFNKVPCSGSFAPSLTPNG
jgi:hypothetical protein